MSTPSKAARRWLATGEVIDGATISVVDGGIAASRRTGVSHHLADAAEVTVDGNTTFAGRWLCGGSSVDAVLLNEDAVACLGCRLAAALPQGPCVYFAWGEGDELLYVGSSVNMPQRVRSHMSQTRWWSEVRRLTFTHHATEFEIRRAEFEAISERPGKYNRDGVRRPSAVAALDLVIGGEDA
jgi:hypothetical protein